MRRDILVGIPILLVAVIIQTAILGRINLLNGQADLLLMILAAWSLQEQVHSAWVWGAAAGLLVALISGAAWYIYPVSYLMVVALGRLLARRIWQAPLLAMFMVVFTGTLVMLMFTYSVRTIFEVSLGFNLSFVRIILPSILINMLLAIPVHSIIRSLATLLHPSEGMA